MAACTWCRKDMLKTDSCNKVGVEIPTAPDGLMDQVPYGKEVKYWEDRPPPERCHDCNCAVGGFHHPGCDMEQCPKCSSQLIGCGCTQISAVH